MKSKPSSSSPDYSGSLKQLQQLLQDVPGMVECGNSPHKLELEKIKDGERGYQLARPTKSKRKTLRIEVHRHHPIEVDGLVIDRRLGSIGLIYFLPYASQKGTKAGKKAEREINYMIENAAYLRHLLSLERSEQNDPTRHVLPAIEIVFLDPFGQKAQNALADHLRHSLQESALLHNLSIGVAMVDTTVDSPEARDAQLRRAFCWLMAETERWFDGLAELHRSSPVSRATWQALELKDFRRPGKRVWQKKAEDRDTTHPVRLHVIHGPNGSGKSTLAEGFEYVVTGDSTRLGPPALDNDEAATSRRLQPLIYHRGDPEPRTASGRIVYTNEESIARSVPPKPRDSQALKIPGRALRLDQRLVDDLATLGPDTRARVWLETFFADEGARIHDRKRAKETIEQALQKIAPSTPSDSPQTSRSAALLELTGRFSTEETITFWEVLYAAVLPKSKVAMDNTILGSLGLQLPSLLSANISIKGDGKSGDWDEAHSDGFKKQVLEILKSDSELLVHWTDTDNPQLDSILEDLGESSFATARAHAASEVAHGADYDTTFNRFLRVTALQDLLQKSEVIAKTVENVSAESKEIDEPVLDSIHPRLTSPEINQQLEALRDEEATLRKQIEAWQQLRGDDDEHPHTSSSAHHNLDPLIRAVEANVFSPMVTSEDSARLRELIETQESGQVGELSVGKRGWTKPLLDILHQRRLVTENFGDNLLRRSSQSDVPGSRLSDRAEAVGGLIDGLVRLSRLEQASAEQFFTVAKEESLIPTLEELLALLTPARWAYPPLAATIEDDRFELQSHGIDVGKVLNTAELNTLSLAIYLLCAPRVENPFRVIFLDDPFQNMDELTVTTAARAIARLMRVWRSKPPLDDWEIVLLLHGEENCQRVLADAATAYYGIPWLSPIGVESKASEIDEVRSLPGTENATLLFPEDFLVVS